MDSLTSEMLKPLTVAQLKKVRVLIDDAIQQNDVDLQQTEKERNNALREIGNHLHDSVPVSNDEVSVDLYAGNDYTGLRWIYCLEDFCFIVILLCQVQKWHQFMSYHIQIFCSISVGDSILLVLQSGRGQIMVYGGVPLWGLSVTQILP